MVDISSYAPPLSAVGAARASTTQATKVATSYGERPTYRDDAVTAGTAIKAMSSKISRLNDVRSLERIDGLLDVTLATTDAIVDTLTELKTLATRMQDQSLTDNMRRTLTHEYNKLLPRIDELTEKATFGGRNLLNPTASQISGDLELPDGQVIEARDLRLKDPPIVAHESLASAYNGRSAVAGTPTLARPGTTLETTMNDGSIAATSDGTGRILFGRVPGTLSGSTITVRMEAENYASQVIFTLEATGEYFRTFFVGSIDDQNRLRVKQSRGVDTDGNFTGGARALVGPTVENGSIVEWTVKLDESGTIHGYLNGEKYGTATGPYFGVHGSGNETDVTIGGSTTFAAAPAGHFGGNVGHFAFFDEALSEEEISQLHQDTTRGIGGWVASGGSISSGYDAKIRDVLAVQASIGGAARTAKLKAQLQQRMIDAIDTATARLVNKDIDRLGALRAAGEVREQLAQAMMQTQTNTLFAQTSLFSNALGMFDTMNIGGFHPLGLETAGARDALQTQLSPSQEILKSLNQAVVMR